MIDQKAQDYFYRNVWQSNIHLFKYSGENLVKEINKTKIHSVIIKPRNIVGLENICRQLVPL